MKKVKKQLREMLPVKTKKKLLQARVDEDILAAVRKAAKLNKIKFQDAVQAGLKWFLFQSKL